MKTLFITSFHPHISRNILSTEAFTRLIADDDLRIVLVVPDYKTDYFRAYFGSARVMVEGVSLNQSTRAWRGVFFKRMSQYLLDTDTVRLRKRFKYYCDHRSLHFILARAAGLLGKSFWVRRIWRAWDQKFSPRGFFFPLFHQYKPCAVFATDIQNENDVGVMQDADRLGIPVIGMIRSWDNATQRIFRVFPDTLLVGSWAIYDDAVRVQGFPPRCVVITGQPHYDRYLQAPVKTREEFFRSYGLDETKRLILYAPVGDLVIVKGNDTDQYVMELLGGLDAQILVRMPPDEAVRLVHFTQPKNMVIHRPGHIFKNAQFTDREIRKEDDESLIDQIYYSDAVVTGPTSIGLDSALLGKPVIAVDIYPTPDRHFFDKIYQYHYTHMKKMRATEGMAYADTREKLFEEIKTAMTHPRVRDEGRARMRAYWFSHADGHAGERVAQELITFLNRAVSP